MNGSDTELNGLLCAPGTYTATLNKFEKGSFTQMAGPVSVEVVPMMKGTLDGKPMDEVVAFWRDYEKLSRDVEALTISVSNANKKVDRLFKAAMKANVSNELLSEIGEVRAELSELDNTLNGNPAKNQIGERNRPLLSERLFALSRGITTSTYGPTDTHQQTMQIINDQLNTHQGTFEAIQAKVKDLGDQVLQAGGSWVEGID
jgi:hypothetical protein